MIDERIIDGVRHVRIEVRMDRTTKDNAGYPAYLEVLTGRDAHVKIQEERIWVYVPAHALGQ